MRLYVIGTACVVLFYGLVINEMFFNSIML